MKRGALLPLLVMVGLGAGERAEAGTFRITSVQYEVWPLEFNGKQIRVLVLGSAKYSGKLDLEDTDWEIQTFLNDDIGGDLDDWDNPDWWGYGNTGTTIPYSGYEVFCDLACAADAAVSKCDVQETSVTYKGKAGVTIDHPFFPEIDIEESRTMELVLPGGIRLYGMCVVRSPGTCNQLRVGLQLPIVQQGEATRRLDGRRELHASTLRDRRPVGVTLVR